LIASQTTRGFTGHEQLADVGLVHMNGRVYDPMLGRFGTPDPTTESPYSTQGWNRYTYVGNSPLNFTDPSGYCFASCFWQAPFKALGAAIRRTPILGNILTVAATAICTAVTGAGPVCGALASAAVTGLASGDLGQALKAGAIALATAVAFQGVGEITGHTPGFGTGEHFANILGHAAVGCGSAVASGGKCGPGALSGAVGSFVTPLTRGLDFTPRLVVTSVSGGLASVAGGGKFANGAVTAAFGYLFNEIGAAATAPGGVAVDEGVGPWFGASARRLLGIFGMVLSLSGDTPQYQDIYRAVDPAELAHLSASGDYGFSPNKSGKYFALTLNGAYDFAEHPFNASMNLTVTQTTVPKTVLREGFFFKDPGGAGPSVYFSDAQLPKVYSTMTRPQILPSRR